MPDDVFLKIDGIPGESTDAKHKGDIDVESFSWGLTVAQSPGGAGAGAGKAEFDGVSFVARTSAASPLLFLSAASGKHLKEAMLTIRHAGKSAMEYIKIKLSDVTVDSYHQSESSIDDRPTDEFSVRFKRIDFSYSPQKPDGSLGPPVRAGWDISKGAGF